MDVPSNLIYTRGHEWILRSRPDCLRIGITDFAQDQLGEIAYVDLPDLGARFTQGKSMADVESMKTIGEVHAPTDGRIAAVNDQLRDQPDLVNTDPYGEGWIVELEVEEGSQWVETFDAAAYEAQTELSDVT